MRTYLIVGLGNPGKDYVSTRHNAGFVFVDALRVMWDFPTFSQSKKCFAEISKSQHNSTAIILAKPMTFMNHSGQSIRALMDYYDIAMEHLIVVYDELDLTLGTYKISLKGRSAGHNGVGDTIVHLGTDAFTRVRIGIDHRDIHQRQNMSGSDYVLQRFANDELAKIHDLFPHILDELAI